MNKKIIDVFGVQTEAIATNRGFYYQYLCTLKKWVNNFVNNRNIETLTEVEDDIKEVGEELIFTQVKSYASSFSLNSPEIKKSLFNFFLLYLKYNSSNKDISFCFATNSSISQKEKLLTKWINDLNFNDNSIFAMCSKKVKEILIKEVKLRKNKKLGKNIAQDERDEIQAVSQDTITIINSEASTFTKHIVWEFGDSSPEDSIKKIKEDIYTILQDPKFESKPVNVLFSVLLSEIYKNSQNKEKEDRLLNKNTILNLLKRTDDELQELVNRKLTKLLQVEFESLKYDVEQIKIQQETHDLEINILKSQSSSRPRTYPKNLNVLPDIYTAEILGWEDFSVKTNDKLQEKKMILIHSEGGMGKTSFAKKYIKNHEQFDHLIWVNVEQSIPNAILLDDVLIANLGIELSTSNDITQSFNLILNELNKIDGNNLLVIDIQKCEDEFSDIKSLSSLYSWKKLILTRSYHKTLPSIKLPRISFEDAKQIYLSNSSKDKIEDNLFLEFFNYVDYNVLVIELVAKTIENSFDVTLNSLFTSLKEQRLDDENLAIDIDINDEIRPIRLFNFLIKKFSLPNLKNGERNYLAFLILLPSYNVLVEDLILINGKELYDENKVHIINILNALEKKGLVEFNNNRERISIHKIIQEVLIYHERKQLNPFISSMLFISWLASRIEEGYNSPKKSFRFLKYAESILDSVKEPFRRSVYQPLLLLENEFLFAKRFYFKSKSILPKLIDLAERAEKYLGLNDVNLAIMYNNLALGYAEDGSPKKAINCFKKALSIFRDNLPKTIKKVIVTSNNLSNTYLKEGDLENTLKHFAEVQKLREKYNLYNDQQLSIEYRILAKSFALGGEYDTAIKHIKSGIVLHKSLPLKNRNDFYLAAYYSDLSHLYLKKHNINHAITSQEIGVKILEDMSLDRSEYLCNMYQVLAFLYGFDGQKDKQKEMKNKIEIFEINKN
ncbi:hypothetical protein [Psychroserpens luteus]|uniref:NB-ARC domain-containing protein n=1 Tax=Psychroserpens luteus TaxID=1434066 RepID=A0ABW5ZXX1_9FLAO|nr:hypothetical protein [Psychroserpens luteus]